MKVCHITSAHESTDDRIFLKECCSLADEGFDVYIVAHGENREIRNVKIVGIGPGENSRFGRMINGSNKVYKKALSVDADIYHFHDPELLPVGLKLKKRGKTVIYDSHEDVPRQIMAKEWIPFFLRKLVSVIFERYEKRTAKKIGYVIAATDHIAEQFLKENIKAEVIKNYPVLDDIRGENDDYAIRKDLVCYVGGLTKQRGISNIIQAIERCECELLLAGDIDASYKQELEAYVGYEKTTFLGYLNRIEVEETYNRSKVGLCVLRRTPNHVNALAIKIFEYMAAGIPIICSNFPIWIEIVEKNGCGICVDPENLEDISKAIQHLLDNGQEAKRMGDKGKEIVKKQYNWKIEKKKLIDFYKTL